MSILDRIAKLHRKASSARDGGSLAEAEAFAQKVSALLFEHKLAMTDLPLDDPARPKIGVARISLTGKERRSLSKWRMSLLASVANAHFCKLIVATDGGTGLVGLPQDIEGVAYLYRELRTIGEALVRGRGYTQQECRAARAGFIHAVVHRMWRARREAERSTATALALFRSTDQAIADFLGDLPERSATLEADPASVAYAEGVATGMTAPISPPRRGLHA